MDGPATGKEDDDDGSGSSYEGAETAGAFDQRLEFRHGRRESPVVDKALLTRLRISPGLTILRRLLRVDDLGNSEPSEICLGRELPEMDSELGPGESTSICDSTVGVGMCAGSRCLELLCPMMENSKGMR